MIKLLPLVFRKQVTTKVENPCLAIYDDSLEKGLEISVMTGKVMFVYFCICLEKTMQNIVA